MYYNPTPERMAEARRPIVVKALTAAVEIILSKQFSVAERLAAGHFIKEMLIEFPQDISTEYND